MLLLSLSLHLRTLLSHGLFFDPLDILFHCEAESLCVGPHVCLDLLDLLRRWLLAGLQLNGRRGGFRHDGLRNQ
jgi:hypothetical protein